MPKFSVSLALLWIALAAGAQQTIALSDMRLSGYSQEVLSPLRNEAMTGGHISTGGKKFDKGLSVHAPFSAFVYTGKQALKFTGTVGVDDGLQQLNQPQNLDSFTRTDGLKTFFYTAGQNSRRLHGVGYASNNIKNGAIELIVYGDGRELWRSGVMRKGEGSKDFTLDVQGIEVIALKVTDGGDGISGDVAALGSLMVATTNPANLQFVSENYAATIDKNGTAYSAKLMAAVRQLPLHKALIASKDWLLEKPQIKAAVSRTTDNQIVISNGLVSRTLNINPNAATISLKNLVTGEEFIRSVQPEAVVVIDGEAFDIGGLGGQVDKGYLLAAWLKDMYSLPGAFRLSDVAVRDITPAMEWTTKRWLPLTQWKATGKELILYFTHPARAGVVVQVHHKIYDGIPLLSKTIAVANNSGRDITINHFTGEIIAYPEKQNFVETPVAGSWVKPNFYIENSYAFGGMVYAESDQALSWEADPAYTSQVNYQMQTPCIVKSQPVAGPSQIITNGQSWIGFDTYIMPLDGADQERNTLSQRKMYRMLAPWVTQNPIFMHLTSTKPEVVREAVDQCVATGYEMIILSFGSGLNMEDTSAANLDKFKTLAGYAHSKGIGIGGYSLFSSRTISPQTDVIDIKTGKPGGATFGNAPCMGSRWGIDYLQKIQHFLDYTGFDLLEHDGPYPGDFCASKEHPGHADYYDSQWRQWKQSTTLYQALLRKGIYTNVPDFYILSGSNKTGIGYREVNWSLPRAQQLMLGRQNLYDGTWTRTPSMGWTFVPLTQYQGGGAEATLEPLSQHLKEYAAHMQQNYGSGVQACYRGNRLYDTEATKAVVQKEIVHYKKYRDILNADIIHLRRPDGRDWDGILHADPALKQKGFAMLYNPLGQDLPVHIKLPLYYTGISGAAMVCVAGKPAQRYPLNAKNEIELNITIPANGNTWLVLEEAR